MCKWLNMGSWPTPPEQPCSRQAVLTGQTCRQVSGCGADLSTSKVYYQRYRICEEHLKLSSLLKDNIPQRFCQQCGRFHLLSDFDGNKRCAPGPRLLFTLCWLQAVQGAMP